MDKKIIGIDICVGFENLVSKCAANAVWCARFLVVSKLPLRMHGPGRGRFGKFFLGWSHGLGFGKTNLKDKMEQWMGCEIGD